MGNYIKIHRKILEWEWYKNLNTCRLFFHLLLKANWKEGKFEGINIPRGAFVSSIVKLSAETGLTQREVRTAVSHLKTTGELTSKSYSKFTVFYVNNYDLYQLDDEQSDRQATGKRQASDRQATGKRQASDRQATGKRQTNDKLTTTIEEYKEGKEGKQENKEEGKKKYNITVSNETVCQTDIRRVVDAWNELEAYGIKPISRISCRSQRYQRLAARIREYSIDDVLNAIDKIKVSDFLRGKNGKGWTITFDWFVLPNNFPKVLDGNYDGGNRRGQGNQDILSEWRNS